MLKNLNDKQVRITVETLIGDGQLPESAITGALSRARREAETRLAVLGNGKLATRTAPRAMALPRKAASATAPRKRQVTDEQRRSRKLQGKYLSLIRQIPASERDTYKVIAQDKGRHAAITAMRKVLKGGK